MEWYLRVHLSDKYAFQRLNSGHFAARYAEDEHFDRTAMLHLFIHWTYPRLDICQNSRTP